MNKFIQYVQSSTYIHIIFLLSLYNTKYISKLILNLHNCFVILISYYLMNLSNIEFINKNFK